MTIFNHYDTKEGDVTVNNKKLGGGFEAQLCGILAENGFWAHNLAQNAAGQPADVIAVRDGQAYLIDCKACTGSKFHLSRIEENQELAMARWEDCGNGSGWFALKIADCITMVSHTAMKLCRKLNYSALTTDVIVEFGTRLEEWIVQC